jgi:hypothetical protein
MKIYHKDKWGFLFFYRYSFYVEDEKEGLIELIVDEKTWNNYNIGDYYEIH